MKLQLRIIIALLLTLGIIFYFFIDYIKNEVGTRYVESLEESLNDTVNILAALIETEIKQDKIDTKLIEKIFKKAYHKKLNAKIHRITKSNIDVNVYIVNKQGIVIYDSNNGLNQGQNFSEWNDVYLTLRGKYGVRMSSRDDFNESFYVAAPIKYNDEIIGAITVVKSKKNLDAFKEITRTRIISALILAFILFTILLIAMSFWITLPITRLTKYVRSLKKENIHALPKLGSPEIRGLGKAFEDIFDELEGKRYIEKYVQTLTHEIKSPLSSIRGASELLMEGLPAKDNLKFYKNIKTESIRIENLITRLLQLSLIENQKELKEISKINIHDMIEEIIMSHIPQINKKDLIIENRVEENNFIYGERFLIRQSIANVFENAIKFSYNSGVIKFFVKYDGTYVTLEIIDKGRGIPGYAEDKIYDRFYSLPCSEDQKKSTGLGLSFVKEAMSLHSGTVEVTNNQESGATAKLKFPKK